MSVFLIFRECQPRIVLSLLKSVPSYLSTIISVLSLAHILEFFFIEVQNISNCFIFMIVLLPVEIQK